MEKWKILAVSNILLTRICFMVLIKFRLTVFGYRAVKYISLAA